MFKVVYKFGGTSLATAENIRLVCDIICKDKPSFIVVSAVAGITDLLVDFCSTLEGRKEILRKIEEKHQNIVNDLAIPFSVAKWISRLLPYVQPIQISDLDFANILSVGEDISASLVRVVCSFYGWDLGFLEARSIILTDDNYLRATPNLDLMKEHWDELEFNETSYITQGFIGSNSSGDTVLLGRGGSDYSAALIAEISTAAEVRIYTDVNGIYTMDPKVISDAQRIPELSFEEMQNLASFGAKVLYPPMLVPCIRAGIPIFVTSTFDPEKGGTWVYAVDKSVSCEPRIKALSLSQHQSFCSVDYNVLGYRGLEEILRVLESYGIDPKLMTAQNNVIGFVMDDDVISQEVQERLIDILSISGVTHLHHNVALITMIGDNLSSSKIVSTITEKLKALPWPVFCFCQNSMALSFIVSSDLAEGFIEQLHNDYVKQKVLVV
ncbi:Lysine-sensitive aspartokinase 3,aspartate kinase,Homoserine dehydrogenase,aspartate kinase,Amino acid kinase family [Chlamydia serpentis]|uniref:Aspartokinase n=1 Tax=Chlamydia serpentis TaxID=1967782 RepID=A0A2R8FCK9_9CHLA|nr:aspartate kinase [Chlamydia serpentis]SPN74154.1 Lysine-sensitive aspartokinase 3,aspartate kinase,Homoserine dehydrogenase,aspartate kinase,Amino acid kinase family [Chlamydia serpentis]